MNTHLGHHCRWVVLVVIASISGCNGNDQTSVPPESTNAAVGPQDLVATTCSPCELGIVPSALPFAFTVVFDSVASMPGDRAIREITVARRGRPGWSQSLAPGDMPSMAVTDSFSIGALDIDFDGVNDFFILTSRGAANAYAEYWRFRPAADSFEHVGNHPVFSVDTASRTLATYERLGDAGRVYESRRYRFVDDSLRVVEIESQKASSTNDVYVRTTSRLDGRTMRVVRTDTVRTPP